MVITKIRYQVLLDAEVSEKLKLSAGILGLQRPTSRLWRSAVLCHSQTRRSLFGTEGGEVKRPSMGITNRGSNPNRDSNNIYAAVLNSFTKVLSAGVVRIVSTSPSQDTFRLQPEEKRRKIGSGQQ